ncbi:MAG: hypothetical protein HY852_02535 [Bradyrhizobium sp.]|uniref:hypothetical protein n=1 Tax=Bradyrhizobium sp. TaxID=376 RepID=UPI0025BB160B|nr:hypothetical protein [Bradyrhizobium sp.]MBI5260680.1 hypothetical protein [Bradyrhizobium sp.]
MAAQPNPVATHDLPFFITAPGDTDTLFNVVAVFVLLCVIGLGVIFLTIHSLPERVAHKSKKVQFDIVAILGLLALLSHEHVFWVAALLLAFIDIPDFSTPVKRVVTAVEAIARQQAPATLKTSDSGEEMPKTPIEGQPQPGGPVSDDAAPERKSKKGTIHA